MNSFETICVELKNTPTKLIAVSKTKPVDKIMPVYLKGQRIFGENKVQEMVDKHAQMPKDIEWHLIGHLQTNKVKYIAPFVSMIHSIDSLKLLNEVEKQAAKNNRVIPVLLQMHVANEETKFGLDQTELIELMDYYLANPINYAHVNIVGIMGMATNTNDITQIRNEFKQLKGIFQFIKNSYFINKKDFTEISMGMSSDYKIAMEEGSTMVRIGSLLFGRR
jgi:pyridoxal phosphate enzyme (YggS family)